MLSFASKLVRALLDGTNRLFREPLQYKQDGLFTTHGAGFLRDPLFIEAYELATRPHQMHADMHIEWRVYVCCWAAVQATHLEGDFVECGVNTGVLSRAVAHYVDFANHRNRTFYLMDTYEGFPPGQFTEHEIEMGLARNYKYDRTYDLVRDKFQDYPNIRLIKGAIPASLSQVKTDKVAYLSIDMNAVVPEMAAIDFFWDKLVPGAPVVLDDYNWRVHINQKRAFDEFAARKKTAILALPTGQGLIIKP